MSAPNLNYMLGHSPSETERLDMQQLMVEEFLGGKIIQDPDLNPQKIQRVLDVATGSGMWLERVRTLVPENCQLVGCDIALPQVAPSRRSDDRYSFFEHDCTQPFPTDHHGKYDLVNIRWIVLAMSAEDYIRTLHNAAQTLKSGGVLQIIEPDPYPPADSADSSALLIREFFEKTLGRTGKDPPNLIANMEQQFSKAGLSEYSAKTVQWPWGKGVALEAGLSEEWADKQRINLIAAWAAFKKVGLHFGDIAGMDTEEKWDEKALEVNEYLSTAGWFGNMVVAHGRKP